jgi:uncharacterized membrane protein YfcA
MLLQGGLGLFSGSLIGFSLGLVGGGGSILAVPLLVYVVGVGDPHVAIGTSAVPVAANAATNLLTHARMGMGNGRVPLSLRQPVWSARLSDPVSVRWWKGISYSRSLKLL